MPQRRGVLACLLKEHGVIRRIQNTSPVHVERSPHAGFIAAVDACAYDSLGYVVLATALSSRRSSRCLDMSAGCTRTTTLEVLRLESRAIIRKKRPR
jgi:hypothetical protein